jgi:hypothetical protein
VSLTQAEADYLMAMEKRFESDDPLILGDTPLSYVRPLISLDRRERFLLDIWRGRLNLKKYRLQERARSVIVLVRVDAGGAPHTNPDGEIIPCPHIHLYREGFDDKWAYPLANYHFRTSEDIVITLEDFARFCNITGLPPIQRSWCDGR